MEIPERILTLAKTGGWIGVDFDGTLFTFEGDTWVAWNVFGSPIQPMIDRVLRWLKAGVGVRIVTARIGLPLDERADGEPLYSARPSNRCVVTGQAYSDLMMVKAMHFHMKVHGLPPLTIQCFKGGRMIELWDDRAVQVIANTGRTLAEEHAAELEALRGKQFDSGGDTMFERYDPDCIPGN